MENKAFDKEEEVGSQQSIQDGGAGEKSTDVKQPPDDNVVVKMSDEDEEKKSFVDKPYAGMGKEDLLRFSQTPFWVNLRLACVIIFWLGWLALLTAVIVLTIVLPRCEDPRPRDWWEKGIFYHIYPRSFYDSDGDGIGDIQGIIAKLDHIDSLQANAIVLGSIYQSHGDGHADGRDFGYDVTDHKAVDADVGTVEDLEELIEKAEGKDIKVILDFIPNHTGSSHQWFMDSDADPPENEKENYYIWRDCTVGAEPNNWLSEYNDTSAWILGTAADRCYYASYYSWQPELNLRSEQVRQELDDIMLFWLRKGVAGFRAVNVDRLFEDYDLRDEEEIDGCTPTGTYECLDHKYTTDQPEIHDLISRWHTLLEEVTRENGTTRILLTDAPNRNQEQTMAYYGTTGRNGAHLPINAKLTELEPGEDAGKAAQGLVDWWMYSVPEDSTPNWLISSQDIGRLPTVMESADPENDPDYVNALLMLQLTLPGTILVYYGDEIGMINGVDGTPIKDQFGRDPYRSPMQWDNTDHAGFVNGTNIPWLPVNVDYEEKNVEDMRGEYFSAFELFKRLATLHREEETFHVGDFEFVTTDHPDVIAYIMERDGYTRFFVAINFGDEIGEYDFRRMHDMIPGRADVVYKTHDNVILSEGDDKDMSRVHLRPGEGAVFSWDYTR